MSLYKHIHFIGIGGIGMSGIAKLFIRRGVKVSGSDLKQGGATEELKQMGAAVYAGHNCANIAGADLVVYSSAIRDDNPEMLQARKNKVPLWKRAQALAELMRGKRCIAVSGSHGKTTTTSLVSCLLLEAGLKPTVAIGGILKNIGDNACSGDGDFFVAEADESDGSFLYYRPKYSIITNIDYEHLDYYRDFPTQVGAFREFIAKTDKDGCVFCCADDRNLKGICGASAGRRVLFGLQPDSQVYAANIKMKDLSSEFDCFFNDKFLGHFGLSLAGRHNISNALAVVALGMELGIAPEVIKRALANYQGALRRIEVKFKNKDYLFIDDYAHHPTEIKATLSAIRGLKRRVVAIFQPHRYSRTKLLLDEFGAAFSLADSIVITDIYPAGEKPIEGVSGNSVYEKIKINNPDKEVAFLAKEEIPAHILKIIRPGDLVITLGAGDIVKACDELVARFKN